MRVCCLCISVRQEGPTKFILRRPERIWESTTDKSKLQQQETAENICNIETGDTLQASGILRRMALTFIFIKGWSFQTGRPRDQAPPCIHRTNIKTCFAPVVLNNASLRHHSTSTVHFSDPWYLLPMTMWVPHTSQRSAA